MITDPYTEMLLLFYFIVITLTGHIMMVVISATLLATGYDLLPVDFEKVPLVLSNLPHRKRDLAWSYRNQYTNRYDRSPTAYAFRTLSYRLANIELYYDAGEGNIFTKHNLEKIQSIENRITSVSEYSNYCQLTAGSSSTCAKPVSILRFFDGTLADIDSIFNDTRFSNIPSVLYTALTHNATKSDFQFFLGKSYSITNSTVYSTITRSIIPLGYPLQGYSKRQDYQTHVQNFSGSYLAPVLQDIRSNTDQFDFTYRSHLLWLDVVLTQIMLDVLCAIGSIVFIFCFILGHTKSLWITGFAVLSILTSFVCTNLIYRVVLDFRYIGFFHVLTIFIVLGIGADDIYVFYDVWRNTGHEDYPTLAHRLSDAYRKSVFSMLFTSTTTAVAFFASAISPLLATRSFGVFSGIVIIVNYISVIIYFPTVVIMYHTKFQHLKWPCVVFCKQLFKSCCRKSKDCTEETSSSDYNIYSKKTSNGNHDVFTHPITRTPTVVSINLFDKDVPGIEYKERSDKDYNTSANGYVTKLTVSKGIDRQKNKVSINSIKGIDNTGFVEDDFGLESVIKAKQNGHYNEKRRYGSMKQTKKKGIFVRFFRDKYFNVVTHPVIRWIILAVMAIVLAFFIYQATSLEPDNERVSLQL